MELLWKALAKVVALPKVSNYLINRAERTPYFHLDGYMNRWWLFNGYGSDLTLPDGSRHVVRRYHWLPSIRVHHILRADVARDLHDHPWDARTIILNGYYDEARMITEIWPDYDGKYSPVRTAWAQVHRRKAGDTATLKFGEYHTITEVSQGGVWTLFFTWKYMGTWGFWVKGKKVPWREYTNEGAA